MENLSLTRKESKRYDELHDTAVSRYLDKADWDISKWFNVWEWAEFEKLQKKKEKS